jgi:hypothetical protein
MGILHLLPPAASCRLLKKFSCALLLARGSKKTASRWIPATTALPGTAGAAPAD